MWDSFDTFLHMNHVRFLLMLLKFLDNLLEIVQSIVHSPKMKFEGTITIRGETNSGNANELT